MNNIEKNSVVEFIWALNVILIIGGIIFLFYYIHTQKEDIKYVSEISENISHTQKVGLYKELNDDGLSQETYIKNNDSFEVVRVD